MGCGGSRSISSPSLEVGVLQIRKSGNRKTKKKRQTESGLMPLGMHIEAIRKFVQDHPEITSDQLTTSQTNRQIVKPETESIGKSYIHLYSEARTSTGRPLVSGATVFVSHAWQYAFYDVVVDVMEQYASKHPDAYFWFDLFTNNQNEVSNKDFDWFSTTFRESIKDIGKVLLVLSPWGDPIPIRRCWCLFEIHNALEESAIELNIGLPGSELCDLKTALLKDYECLVLALSNIQAEKADAKTPSDKETILNVIRQSLGGFSRVNQQVKDGLRQWYVNQLKSLVHKSAEDSDLTFACANVMREFGYMDDALKYHQQALTSRQGQFGAVQVTVAASLNKIAFIYHEKCDLNKSLEYSSNAIAMIQTVVGKGHIHPEMAIAYHNMAIANHKLGNMDTALSCYKKSLKIKLKTVGKHDPSVAETYHNMANVYFDKNEKDRALRYYKNALRIDLMRKSENHPTVAKTYNSIAIVHRSKGESDMALGYYQKTLDIRIATLGENHPDVANSYNNLANAYLDKHQWDSVMHYHKKSLALKLQVFGEQHPTVATSYNNMALVYTAKWELDTALHYNNKALQIRLECLGEDHPDVASSYHNIGDVWMAAESNYALRQYNTIDEARENLKKALTIELKVLGEHHQHLMTTYNKLAVLARKRHHLQESMDFYRKAHSIIIRTFGRDSQETRDSYQQMWMLYFESGR